MAYKNQIKCVRCGKSIPEMPESTEPKDQICDLCYENIEACDICESLMVIYVKLLLIAIRTDKINE